MTRREDGRAVTLGGLRFVKRCVRRIRSNLRELLIFVLFFQALFVLVLVPLGDAIFMRLIAQGGNLALSNEQIAVFLLSPFGVLVLLASGAALLATDLARHAGMIWLLSSDLHGEVPSATDAVRSLARRTPRLLELAVREFTLLAIGLAPLLAIGGAIYLGLTRDHDINYLVSVRPPVFWLGAAAATLLGGAGLVLFLLLRTRWMHALPLHIFEREPPRAAMRKSAELARGSFWRYFALILALWVTGFLAATVPLALVFKFFGLLSGAIGGSVAGAVVLAGAFVFFQLVWIGLVTTAGWTLESAAFLELYRQVRGLDKVSAEGPRAPEKSRLLPLAWAGLAVALAVTLVLTVHELTDLEFDVKVTAHRGSSRVAPENSLSALRQAIEDGADYAEIDVQELADGRIVVIHDTDLRRIAGSDRKVWELTVEEISAFEAGSWFSEEFRGERIPTLKQAIDLVRGRMRLNIELKYHGRERRFEPAVVELLARERFREECVITSLNYDGLQAVRKLDAALVIGLIVFESVGDLTRMDVDFLSIREPLATRALISRARGRGMDVFVWTVNDPARMDRFLDLGVANMITDDPVLLRRRIDERAALPDHEKILLALKNWWWEG